MNAEVLKEYGRLLTEAQFELYAFICILMEGEADAADVLQETNLALWTKAETYDFAQPFLPWARSFAYNQVRAYKLRQSRSRLYFDNELVEWFADHVAAEPAGGDIDDKTLKRLDYCLSQLSDLQRGVIKLRYTECVSLKEIAKRIGRTANSVGVLLHRTREILAQCLRQAALQEGAHD